MIFNKIKKNLRKNTTKNDSFFKDKLFAISEFNATQNNSNFTESTEKLDSDSTYYFAKKFSENKLVICEKMTLLGVECVEGYPKYSILTKEPNGNFNFKVITYINGLKQNNDVVEGSILIEYETPNGVESLQIYLTELKNKSYYNANLVDECIKDIANFKCPNNELIK